MAMKKGERYQCSNPDCGCEISVTKGSESMEEDQEPRCCCGEEMSLMEKTADSRSRRSEPRSRQELPR